MEETEVIHFVRSGGSIPADHLAYLVEHFETRGIGCLLHDRLATAGEVVAGHAYVSCDMGVDRVLGPVRDRVFQVQLPHNLTGLKGSDFYRSQANLNVLPGQRARDVYRVDGSDPRYVIGGYAKWDTIYRERSFQKLRRREIAAELDVDPQIPWVVFYPTGPNAVYRGNAHKAARIHARLRTDFGEVQYFFCDHARNRDDEEARRSVQQLRAMAGSDPGIHIVDGGGALRFIAASDLFITDIASSVVTALSMDKPIVFVAIEDKPGAQSGARDLQRGPFLKDVWSLRDFVARYRTPQAMKELFARCVAFDDDRNCERICGIILQRYELWLKGR